KLIHSSINYLKIEYQYIYGHKYQEFSKLFTSIAAEVFTLIAKCDAPYHNLDHTLQVVLVGQEILSGKYLCGEKIPPLEWLNFMISLLCHDIGYLKGICCDDRPEDHIFATGTNGQKISLSPTATGASLTPYHVDRSKLFIAENLSKYNLIDLDMVQLNIELTRFPVPKDSLYKDTGKLPGLVRGADLIGQLSDPFYLAKLPALFAEFEEVGSNKSMGYTDPKELRAGYPRFYWHCVSMYLQHSIRYLEVSRAGQAILNNLYCNRIIVEKEMDRLYNIKQNSFKRLINYLSH
ncbi:MAG: metal-dependent phosphohydrolase, partial [Pseudanabaena sp. ELA607]